MRAGAGIARAVLLLLLGGSLAGCAGVGAEDEAAAPEPDRASGPQVTVFGAPDRFGSARRRLSTGQSLAQVAVPGFATRPGQAFFFPAVTSDGTLFIANMTQTISEFALTGCEMVITCFNPEQATCFDDRSGEAAHFSNLRIPSANGNLSTPSECPSGLRSEVPRVYGSEVDDVEVVVDEQGVERVLFDSFVGSLEVPSPPNHYPMFGSLWKQDGAWRLDPASLRYPSHLFASTTQGPAACPEGRCGATTEMARLPASNRIVVNQYLSGIVMVVDLGGRVLGSYRVPFPRDWCDPAVTEPYVASLRQVNADPTGALGDERFVVVYEGWGPTGQHAQEFSYDELEPDLSERVRPVTAPFQPDSPFHPAPTCGRGRTALTATYDDLGNLWLSSLDRDGKWQTASLVVLRDEGRRRLERECSFLDPASGQPRPWGTVCETDLDVGALRAGGPSPTWSFPSLFNEPILDPATGSMLVVLRMGEVYPVDRREIGGGGLVFVVGDGLHPHPERLAPREPTAVRRFVARAAIDPIRRALWLPVGAEVAYESLSKDFHVGQQLEQYIYRVDLDRAFADNVAVHDVAAPTSAAAGDELTVSVRATLPRFRPAQSFFALYAPGSNVPLATAPWSQGDCQGSVCRFSTSVVGEATAGRPGVYRWHAGLFSGRKRSHLIGRVVVDR